MATRVDGGDAVQPTSGGSTNIHRLSARKKAVFALLVAVGFFLALELLLAACGVRPVLYDEDPFVGFSSYVPLYVAQSGDNGHRQMVTAANKLTWFNEQTFSPQKPHDGYRVFCLGGSTTYGRPYDAKTAFPGWLSEFLREADDSKQWEVINAGGISYASYRVARLMEELIEYEPDLFIIYTGHNEFLERRTYASLAETPETIRNLGSILARTRTFALLRRAVAGSGDNAVDSDKSLLTAEVDAILDRSIGPESYRRDDRLREQIIAHYRINLNRMIDMAHSVGAQVIFVTPASNLRDFSPFKSQFDGATTPADGRRITGLLARAEDALAAGDADEALKHLDRALQLDDRYASTWFLRGRALLAAGDAPAAREAFLRACDEDVCPLRALTPMCEVLRQIAERRRTSLVDFGDIAERRSEHNIPGNDLFLDHVHPTIEGHRILAEALLEEMVIASIVQLDASWSPAAADKIAKRIGGALDNEAHGKALRNLSKVLGWAGKLDEADALAFRALGLSPDDPETLYQAANAHFRRGELDEAEARYRQSLEKNPESAKTYYGLGNVAAENDEFDKAEELFATVVRLDPEYAPAHYNLGNMLHANGKLPAAEIHYRRAAELGLEDARVHNNLGLVLAKQGKLDQAESWFRMALKIDPNFLDAHINLALIFAKRQNFSEAVRWQSRALQLAPPGRRPECDSALEFYRKELSDRPR